MSDFQKIRQEIPIEEVARWLGIEVMNGNMLFACMSGRWKQLNLF